MVHTLNTIGDLTSSLSSYHIWLFYFYQGFVTEDVLPSSTLVVYDPAGFAQPLEIITPVIDDGMQVFIPEENSAYVPNVEYIKWQM